MACRVCSRAATSTSVRWRRSDARATTAVSRSTARGRLASPGSPDGKHRSSPCRLGAALRSNRLCALTAEFVLTSDDVLELRGDPALGRGHRRWRRSAVEFALDDVRPRLAGEHAARRRCPGASCPAVTADVRCRGREVLRTPWHRRAHGRGSHVDMNRTAKGKRR